MTTPIVEPRGEHLASVERWNATHPVGTPVVLRLDNGKDFATKTRSRAEILSGHTPVIWLEGVRGCYILERVRAND